MPISASVGSFCRFDFGTGTDADCDLVIENHQVGGLKDGMEARPAHQGDRAESVTFVRHSVRINRTTQQTTVLTCTHESRQ
jgi:hypothetical protein